MRNKRISIRYKYNRKISTPSASFRPQLHIISHYKLPTTETTHIFISIIFHFSPFSPSITLFQKLQQINNGKAVCIPNWLAIKSIGAVRKFNNWQSSFCPLLIFSKYCSSTDLFGFKNGFLWRSMMLGLVDCIGKAITSINYQTASSPCNGPEDFLDI